MSYILIFDFQPVINELTSLFVMTDSKALFGVLSKLSSTT